MSGIDDIEKQVGQGDGFDFAHGMVLDGSLGRQQAKPHELNAAAPTQWAIS